MNENTWKWVLLTFLVLLLCFFFLIWKVADNTQTSYKSSQQSDEIRVADYCTNIIKKYWNERDDENYKQTECIAYQNQLEKCWDAPVGWELWEKCIIELDKNILNVLNLIK